MLGVFFKWNLLQFTMYCYLPKFNVWSLAINQNVKKARALTDSTFGINSQFRSRIQTKQEPVDSLNLFIDPVSVMFVSVLPQ